MVSSQYPPDPSSQYSSQTAALHTDMGGPHPAATHPILPASSSNYSPGSETPPSSPGPQLSSYSGAATPTAPLPVRPSSLIPPQTLTPRESPPPKPPQTPTTASTAARAPCRSSRRNTCPTTPRHKACTGAWPARRKQSVRPRRVFLAASSCSVDGGFGMRIGRGS